MSKPLDSTRLQHLQYATERLIKRLHSSTLDEFLADEDLQDIALRQFTVMGEAAAQLSEVMKRRYPQVGLATGREFSQLLGARVF